MSVELYMRRYRVIAADTDVSDLHCIFSIEKSIASDPNKSTVQIYNLSPKTRNSITGGKRVLIEAGYEQGQYGLIYDGDIVVVVNSGMNGADKVTQIVAQDGDLFLNNGFISVSYSAGQKSIDYFKQCVDAAGGECDSVTDDAKSSELPRGKVMFGNTGDYMRQFAKNEEALFFIDDGKINLVKAADPPRGEVVSLSPASGLIGTPEMTEDGVKGRCLLNPMIKLNGLVHIDNANVELSTGFALAGGGLTTGIYKIIKFTHTGDTHGNDWYTEFVGIAQPGIEPVTGASFNKLRSKGENMAKKRKIEMPMYAWVELVKWWLANNPRSSEKRFDPNRAYDSNRRFKGGKNSLHNTCKIGIIDMSATYDGDDGYDKKLDGYWRHVNGKDICIAKGGRIVAGFGTGRNISELGNVYKEMATEFTTGEKAATVEKRAYDPFPNKSQMSGKDVEKFLKTQGFEHIPSKGSADKYRGPNGNHVSVHGHGNKSIPYGTLMSIKDQYEKAIK